GRGLPRRVCRGDPGGGPGNGGRRKSGGLGAGRNQPREFWGAVVFGRGVEGGGTDASAGGHLPRRADSARGGNSEYQLRSDFGIAAPDEGELAAIAGRTDRARAGTRLR